MARADLGEGRLENVQDRAEVWTLEKEQYRAEERWERARRTEKTPKEMRRWAGSKATRVLVWCQGVVARGNSRPGRGPSSQKGAASWGQGW